MIDISPAELMLWTADFLYDLAPESMLFSLVVWSTPFNDTYVL